MLKSYKFRLYPTEEQSILLNKHIDACRFVYNLALECKQMAYAGTKTNISCFELMKQLPELKKDCEWLKEVDSQALQQSIVNLDNSFKSFFKGQRSYPSFKSKRFGKQAFRNPHGNRIIIESGRIILPKFQEGIKIVISRDVNGAIKSVTIGRERTGQYYISILIETGDVMPQKTHIKETTAIGVDLGIKSYIVTSKGDKIGNPKYLKESITRLKYLQRKASKKKKGGANKNKANLKVVILHQKIKNQRKDFLHKLSSKLVSENQTLCFEDLNIAAMVKNRRLSQSISDAGWGMFLEMCKYKCDWYGKNLIQISRFQPSTKVCSNCLATNHTLTLSDREWFCSNCNTLHDRDINAAINIKKYSIKNCGGARRKKPAELSTLVEVMKQEVKTCQEIDVNFTPSEETF